MRIRFIRAGIVSIVATVVLAVITLAIIETSAFGDSADLSYRTLDYDVTATANGDLKVTQHIDVKMRERTDSDDNTKPWKQLFQQYTLNSGTLTMPNRASPSCPVTSLPTRNGTVTTPTIGISPM